MKPQKLINIFFDSASLSKMLNRKIQFCYSLDESLNETFI